MRSRGRSSWGARDEAGQTTVLVIAFATILLLAVAVVVDVSTAFLKRQDLSTLADGAALSAADAGVAGEEVYTGGVGSGPLGLSREAAERGVRTYLDQVGAYATHPGLQVDLRLEGDSVVVDLRAPVDLPFTVPGSPDRPTVGATGSAVTDPEG